MTGAGNLLVAARLAWRDLRSGFNGLYALIACLFLGVAIIAAVAALAAGFEQGLARQGGPLLGGDVEISAIHVQPDRDRLARLAGKGGRHSKVATLRAMAVASRRQALAEVKAVDRAYPLYGRLKLVGGGDPAALMAISNGLPGALVEPGGLVRLGVKVGDTIRLGQSQFAVRGVIADEPDRISGGFIIAPRIVIPLQSLAATGLVQPGSLIHWRYRIRLDNGDEAAVRQLLARARKEFTGGGFAVRSRADAAPGVRRFLDRLTLFLTLAGLSALIVGGVGIANAVKVFIERRAHTIAIMKCTGATNRTVIATFMSEIMLVAAAASLAGAAAGACLPWVVKAVFADILPLPLEPVVKPAIITAPIAFGLLVTVIFSLWPVAATRHIRPAALFRSATLPTARFPGLPAAVVTATALTALIALAFATFANWRITAWYALALAGSFALLFVLARTVVALARRFDRSGSAIARHARANLYRPGAPTVAVVLSLGLALAVFVSLALIDVNISRQLRDELPARAPSFFFLDVRADQRAAFTDFLARQPGVSDIATAPMLRGRIVALNGIAATDVKTSPDVAWALRGDRGLTYAQTVPSGSRLVAGKWWPPDYAGPPLVSFAADVAAGLGLKLGDAVTVNVLGRDVTARIASLRQLDWRSLNINFVMVFSPNTLARAPHMNIVTARLKGPGEAALLARMVERFPAVTAISVSAALAAVRQLLDKLLIAVRAGSALTILVGMVVVASTLAGGLARRRHECAVLKTCGADRGQLIAMLALEYTILGLVSAAFAILAGAVSAWGVLHFVMGFTYRFAPAVATASAVIALLVTLSAGLAVTWRTLSVRPARALRHE